MNVVPVTLLMIRFRSSLWPCLSLLVIFVALSALSVPEACAQTVCPQSAVTGFQPEPRALLSVFDRAATNRLGTASPPLPVILGGLPPRSRAPYVPCQIMKAVGWIETTGWKQFNALYRGTGPTVISFDCGYGIMQITSGMAGGAGFDPARVAAEPTYNIGTGAQRLITSWNRTDIPAVGQNNPQIIENWYYAIWAYNGFSFINNPNNPNFSPSRSLWVCNGSQPMNGWPYQEKVLGCIAFPPNDPLAIVSPGDPRPALWSAKFNIPPSGSTVSNPPQRIFVTSSVTPSCTIVYIPFAIN